MVTKALEQCQILTYGQYKSSWTTDKVKNWIEVAGGIYHTKLRDNTTHLIITQGAWKTKGQLVQNALRANELGNPIKIVSYEWLEECLTSKIKKREAPFMWNTPRETVSLDTGDDKQTIIHSDTTKERPRTAIGLMQEVFNDSTAHYMDSNDVERLNKKRVAEERIQSEAEEAQRRAQVQQKLSMKEQEVLFKRGAARGQGETFSDMYHIYIDSTGFPYEIILTKVDVMSNSNQRLCLTIFESNIWPSSYAVNANLKQSYQPSTNDLIVALGSTLETAFNAFRKIFKEKTGFEWQDPSLLSVNAVDRADELEPIVDKKCISSQTSRTSHGWVYRARQCILSETPSTLQVLCPAIQGYSCEREDERSSVKAGSIPDSLRFLEASWESSLHPLQPEAGCSRSHSRQISNVKVHSLNTIDRPYNYTSTDKHSPEVIDLEDDKNPHQSHTTRNNEFECARDLNGFQKDINIVKMADELPSTGSASPSVHDSMRHRRETEIDHSKRRASCPYESLVLGESLLGKRKILSVQGSQHAKIVRVSSEPI